MRKNRGSVLILVLAGVLLGAGVVMGLKSVFSSGNTKRAAASQKTTEAFVNQAERASSQAASSVVVIGEAAAELPASPQKDFITREAPVALSLLEKPDPQALIDAEHRKVLILSGQLSEANKSYDKAYKASIATQRDLDKALDAKRQSDDALQEAAALEEGATRQRNKLIIVVAILAVLYFYTKMTHFSTGAMATAVNDIKAGANPITALDGVASRTQQWMVNLISRIKSK